MRPLSIMLVAGEASGDVRAAQLTESLRLAIAKRDAAPDPDAQPRRTPLMPRFFGAGGPCMAAAGVELVVDMTRHSVFGLTEVVQQIAKFRRILRDLVRLAATRQPDVVVLVDYGGFNLRLAAAIRRVTRRQRRLFNNWNPRIVYFVSPQVWASRPARALRIERDVDLMLSIIPFEEEWYGRRVPRLKIEFVGHPLVDQLDGLDIHGGRRDRPAGVAPLVVLLPGSRKQEMRYHLPVIAGAVRYIHRTLPSRFWLVLPDAQLKSELAVAGSLPIREGKPPPGVSAEPVIGWTVGDLREALSEADVAVASSGTVTLECAWFRLPTVVLYRVSVLTWWVARQLVRVPHVAMPNLLAGKSIMPELLQDQATPEAVATETLSLMQDEDRRARIREDLEAAVRQLGPPGACDRAAAAILRLLGHESGETRT